MSIMNFGATNIAISHKLDEGLKFVWGPITRTQLRSAWSHSLSSPLPGHTTTCSTTQGSPAFRSLASTSSQASGSRRLEIQHMINVMFLNYPETISPTPLHGKIVFLEISPCSPKGWRLYNLIKMRLHSLLSALFLYSCLVMSNCLWPHGLQHARLPCPSPSPRVCSNSCPFSWWCHPTISSSVATFSSCPQYFPASESFPMSQLFTLGGPDRTKNEFDPE